MSSMRSLQRQEKIFQMLAHQETVSVQELAAALQVSTWTVRRDLNQLEEREVLQRQHGSAKLSATMPTQPTPAFARGSSVPKGSVLAKAQIGQAASRLVYDGQYVALGAGTTTTEVARALKVGSKRLAVVTNSLIIALELAVAPHIQVTCTGGDVHRDYYSLTGPVTERALKSHYYDVSIISVSGIAATQGLTVNSQLNAVMLEIMVQHSHQVIVVAERSKIGTVRFAYLAPLQAADILVTDVEPPAEFQDQLKLANVKLVIASQVGQE